MTLLGISGWYHDAAAAIVQDGVVVAAAEEERFSRIKHDPAFPARAIAWCLEETGLDLDDLDAVVFYEKPFLTFERILESFYAIAPRGFRSFLLAMPHWFGEKLFLKQKIRKGLRRIQPFNKKELRIFFSEHHLSHAGGAFFSSGFDNAAILTIDAVGEWATASIMHGREQEITVLKELHFPHSVGLLYSAFTQFLGFRVNNGEYKLMGLAAYGDSNSIQTTHFRRLIESELVRLYDDGSIELNLSFFGFLDNLQTIKPKKWQQLFGFPLRKKGDLLTSQHAHLALAIQQVTEEIVLRLAKTAKAQTGASKLCISGGVALNCVANGKLAESGLFDEIYVQAAPGDSGGAVGAAMAAAQLLTTNRKAQPANLPLWGPVIDETVVPERCETSGLHWERMRTEDLCETVAQLLASGKIIGWCQGRMEFGPRALGNRSILADPRDPEMQNRINTRVKRRESFRPFAPAIMSEHLADYFDVPSPSPWMQFVHNIKEVHRLPLPEGFQHLPPSEKLSVPTSIFPSVTHADFSARIQEVDQEAHPLFHRLLSAFRDITGCPMLVNTSFNLRGEPIVCTAEDAIRCFVDTELDMLVIGHVLITRESVS